MFGWHTIRPSASTLRQRSSWTGWPRTFSFTIFTMLGPLCVLGLVVPWASYPNHLELTPPRSFAGRGTGATVWHNLLRVGLPIAATPVQVPTVRQNAPIVLTKRRHTIANADRLLLPPCPRPLPKPGINGCTLFVFLIVFLPCFFFSALIAVSFFLHVSWPLVIELRFKLRYLIFVNSS